MFRKVDPKQSFPEMEEEILKFWEDNSIFEKSVKKNSADKPFVFYEGPPTANGIPGLHHVLARAFKDIIPRYKTMKGYRVERKAGWDTHGLPVELQVEKQLGLKNKQEIENIIPGNPRESIIEFNKKCKESVWQYKDLWEKLTQRMGYWVDMKNPYITYENRYIESVWWVIAQIFKTKNKNGESLVYQGHKVVPYCYRCGTALSSHEVAQGYQVVKDNSVFIKFRAKHRNEIGRGVGAVIVNEKNEVLLVKRNEKNRRITWALPGGKLEEGETFEKALKREMKEELGINVKSAKAFSALPDIVEGRLFETVCYKVEANVEPKNVIPDEVEKIEWFDLNNLPEINFSPSKYALKIYKSNQEKFFVSDDASTELANVSFLVWTTTPWTLPGNVALAVGEKIKYSLIKAGNKFLILAKDSLDSVMGENSYEEIKEFEGEDLVGIEYEPLYKTNDTQKNSYRVITGDFVTTQEGTGIVHIAPAFGEDDANVGRVNDLPTLVTVGAEGKISADVPGKGIPVKKKNERNKYAVDELIIEDLKKRELLFKEELYEHDYPFCWRCDTPLIYYAKPSWFIRMSEFSERLVVNNEKINWVPEHFKEGRFGEWLRGVKDWAISRERYWGTPLPIWKCEKCGELKVVESQKELEELSGQKIGDLHKPFIDDVKLKCSCGGEMQRVSEVLDVWFDSGSMPLAQFYYPNQITKENRKKIESGKYFPADYICEAVDQTRGWFYTLHAIATLLNESGKVPTGYAFKNVICLGHILDAKGKKMSKSKGNVVEPIKVIDEYGADMLRWMLYTINQPGLPKRFDIKGMKDIMNRVFRMLWNSYYFFVMYANIDKFQVKSEKLKVKENLLDRWIISEMQTLIREADSKLEAYDIYSTAKSIEIFVDNLSNWYIRRSRKRFWKSENDADKNEAYETLHYVLVTLAKLMAPFTPFISEEIFRNLNGCHPERSPYSDEVEGSTKKYNQQYNKADSSTPLRSAQNDIIDSVHLADFPETDEKLINEKLNKEMASVRDIISEGLQLRATAKIKVRQPLQEVKIKKKELSEEMQSIIKEELNVKNVTLTEKVENIEINTKITEELKLEGQAREVIRFIQEMRKKAGYEVDNRIEIIYSGQSEVFNNIALKKLIAKETLANEILNTNKISKIDLKKTFKTDGKKLEIGIRKI